MQKIKTTKEQVIESLNTKEWISGESLSQQLGISRAAIAKHVNSLRHEDYLIESAPRRGYLLKLSPDPIDINLIKKSLKTKIIGKGEWLYLDNTSSTNQEAMIRGAQNIADGSLILAGVQTGGRGRKGKTWFSAPRSVSFSAVLHPNIPSKKLSLLTLIATLSVQKTLKEFVGLDAKIKWPNDVLINQKKLAGILVEASLSAGEIDWVVIGIGCNINTERSEFPPEISQSITSVLEESAKNYSRNVIYKEIISYLDHYYSLLLNNQEAQIIEDWKQGSDIINKIATIQSNPKVSGSITDINEDGVLVITDTSGNKHLIEIGDHTKIQISD